MSKTKYHIILLSCLMLLLLNFRIQAQHHIYLSNDLSYTDDKICITGDNNSLLKFYFTDKSKDAELILGITQKDLNCDYIISSGNKNDRSFYIDTLDNHCLHQIRIEKYKSKQSIPIFLTLDHSISQVNVQVKLRKFRKRPLTEQEHILSIVAYQHLFPELFLQNTLLSGIYKVKKFVEKIGKYNEENRTYLKACKTIHDRDEIWNQYSLITENLSLSQEIILKCKKLLEENLKITDAGFENFNVQRYVKAMSHLDELYASMENTKNDIGDAQVSANFNKEADTVMIKSALNVIEEFMYPIIPELEVIKSQLL